MHRVTCLSVLALLLLSSSLAPERAWTAEGGKVPLRFEDLPTLVRERNRSVTGAESLKEARLAETGHLLRSYLPRLRAEVGGETFQTGFYRATAQPYGGIEASINVFNSGRDRLEARLRDNRAASSAAEARAVSADAIREARDTFWQIVSRRELIQVLKEALDQNGENLAMATRRISRGLAPESDRLEFLLFRSQLKEEIESVGYEIEHSELHLSTLLGMQPGTRYETPTAIEHTHDETLIAAPFGAGSHPAVAGAQAALTASEADSGQKARWWAPSLDVYAGQFLYTLRDRDYPALSGRYDTVAGVRLTFSLFDGGESIAGASAAALRARAESERLDHVKLAIESEVENARELLRHSHALIHLSEDKIAQGKQYLARVRDDYSRGVKTSLDVLSAAQRLASFRQQYAERRRDYQLARNALMGFLGK